MPDVSAEFRREWCRLWDFAERLAAGTHKEPSHVLGDIGLFLDNPYEPDFVSDYENAPVNAFRFASTGGDGVHFCALFADDGETSPVVLAVPLSDTPNHVVGATLTEFLALGCVTGYVLDYLGYDHGRDEIIDELQTMRTPDEEYRAVLLAPLTEEFQLEPWPDVRGRLDELAAQYYADVDWSEPPPPRTWRLMYGGPNPIESDGVVAEKRYNQPGADLRLAREYAVLTELRGRLPVRPVLEAQDDLLKLGLVDGVPGKELLDAGRVDEVMTACGEILGRIHGLQLSSVPKDGDTFVHGDFDPDHLLLDPEAFAVNAVVDWEFSHYGDRLKDLASCEWYVRINYPEHPNAVNAFYDAYPGAKPEWMARYEAMLERLKALKQRSLFGDEPGVMQFYWSEMEVTTANWRE